MQPGLDERAVEAGRVHPLRLRRYEGDLFDGVTTPALSSATLLIETHDVFVPGTTERLRSALDAWHVIERISTDDARRQSTADLSFLSPADQPMAQHEWRPEQAWLLCRPR